MMRFRCAHIVLNVLFCVKVVHAQRWSRTFIGPNGEQGMTYQFRLSYPASSRSSLGPPGEEGMDRTVRNFLRSFFSGRSSASNNGFPRAKTRTLSAPPAKRSFRFTEERNNDSPSVYTRLFEPRTTQTSSYANQPLKTDIQRIFDNLDLPLFTRSHLALPSNAIQDGLKDLVLRWSKHGDNVSKKTIDPKANALAKSGNPVLKPDVSANTNGFTRSTTRSLAVPPQKRTFNIIEERNNDRPSVYMRSFEPLITKTPNKPMKSDIQKTLDKLELPLFTRNHLALPSNAIQDGLKKLVLGWSKRGDDFVKKTFGSNVNGHGNPGRSNTKPEVPESNNGFTRVKTWEISRPLKKRTFKLNKSSKNSETEGPGDYTRSFEPRVTHTSRNTNKPPKANTRRIFDKLDLPLFTRNHLALPSNAIQDGLKTLVLGWSKRGDDFVKKTFGSNANDHRKLGRSNTKPKVPESNNGFARVKTSEISRPLKKRLFMLNKNSKNSETEGPGDYTRSFKPRITHTSRNTNRPPKAGIRRIFDKLDLPLFTRNHLALPSNAIQDGLKSLVLGWSKRGDGFVKTTVGSKANDHLKPARSNTKPEVPESNNGFTRVKTWEMSRPLKKRTFILNKNSKNSETEGPGDYTRSFKPQNTHTSRNTNQPPKANIRRIFDKLDLPLFTRNHLALPSNAIQDGLKHLVLRWSKSGKSFLKPEVTTVRPPRKASISPFLPRQPSVTKKQNRRPGSKKQLNNSVDSIQARIQALVQSWKRNNNNNADIPPQIFSRKRLRNENRDMRMTGNTREHSNSQSTLKSARDSERNNGVGHLSGENERGETGV